MIGSAFDTVLQGLGSGLAVLYIVYALFFLMFGFVFWIHEFVLIYLLASTWKPRFRLPIIALLVEVLYGLVNPLIYLVILEHSPFVKQQWALSVAAWVLLVAIWSSRFLMGFDPFRRSRAARLYVVGLAIAALACLVAFAAKDVLYAQSAGSMPPWGFGWFVPGLLYVIAGVLVVPHMRSAGSEAAWGVGRAFFLSAPRLGWVALMLILGTLAVSAYRPSVAQVERLVVHHRADIEAASRSYRIDPALIASIVYVTHRELTTPFTGRLEKLAMGAWRVDAHDNFFLGKRLDVSLGIAQIKPLTAMAALVIQAAPRVSGHHNLAWAVVSGLGHPVNYKEYRSLRILGDHWKLPAAALEAIDTPFRGPLPKRQVVEALFDDRRNIEMCALILALYAAQWETANPAWSIRRRPEILATLYQIGFEKSRPKPDPRPNRFGERVGDVYRSPFIQRTFGAAAA